MAPIIYLNNIYLKVDQAVFDALLPGNIEGQGAFETMRLYDGKIFAFKEHMKRLARGLRHFHMRAPLSPSKILRTIGIVSRKNKLKNARIRVVVWRRQNEKFICINAEPLKLPSSRKYKTGFKVMTVRCEHRRRGRPDVKSIDYRMLRKISKQARTKGFDEAVLLNGNNEIVEGTRTNIFLVKAGCLLTPALKSGCLNGITRQKVIECGRLCRIPVKAMHLGVRQLRECDEAFLTGSTLEVMPIRSVDGKLVGKDQARRFTKAIQTVYRSLIRRELARR